MTQTNWVTHIEQIIDYALADADDDNVAIGPLCRQPSDGASGWCWYFMICTSGNGCGFRCDRVIVPPGQRERYRQRIVRAFLAHSALAVHDVGDELVLARLCERLWPGELIADLRKTIERERGGMERPAD